MEITALEITVTRDEMREHLEEEVDDALNRGYFEADETYIDTDGTLTARYGTDLVWDIEEVEERFRTGFLANQDTGDFPEPGLCSMEKDREIRGDRFVFRYNVPKANDELERVIDQQRETIDLLLGRLGVFENLRHLIIAHMSNTREREGQDAPVLETINLPMLEAIVNIGRWGDNEMIQRVNRNISLRAQEVRGMTRNNEQAMWTTPSTKDSSGT